MKSLCLDDGILQSFYDGELSPAKSEQVAHHLATCERCTSLASEVEQEMAFTSTAFEHEMSLGVPTERLRVRLADAIAAISPATAPATSNATTSGTTRVREWFAGFTRLFELNPQTAWASVGVFVVLLAIAVGVVLMRGRNADMIAGTGVNFDGRESGPEMGFKGKVIPDEVATPGADSGPSRSNLPNRRKTSRNPVGVTAEQGANQTVAMLPGEKDYLQAIAVLSTTIATNGESSLLPTLRSDYERNLAVVNQAIKATQQQARSNPKDPDAAEFLYSAYQSKLDLLGAVAQQSQPLIAER